MSDLLRFTSSENLKNPEKLRTHIQAILRSSKLQLLLPYNRYIFLRMSGEIGSSLFIPWCPIYLWHPSLVEVGRNEIQGSGNPDNLCVQLIA